MVTPNLTGRQSHAFPRTPGVRQHQVGDGSAAVSVLHASWSVPLVPVPTADTGVQAHRVCGSTLQPWARKSEREEVQQRATQPTPRPFPPLSP
jgi:hypothetical protein